MLSQLCDSHCECYSLLPHIFGWQECRQTVYLISCILLSSINSCRHTSRVYYSLGDMQRHLRWFCDITLLLHWQVSVEIQLVCLLRKMNSLFRVLTFGRWHDMVGSGGKGNSCLWHWCTVVICSEHFYLKENLCKKDNMCDGIAFICLCQNSEMDKIKLCCSTCSLQRFIFRHDCILSSSRVFIQLPWISTVEPPFKIRLGDKLLILLWRNVVNENYYCDYKNNAFTRNVNHNDVFLQSIFYICTFIFFYWT
jgi:hypothetical protein